jgi:hypothetical protein
MRLFKLNFLLKLYAWFKLPLLAFANPTVIELNDSRSVIKLKLGYRTRNHLNVMYFGALSIAAELSIAVKAVTSIQASGQKIDFIFKDFSAQFLKRCDGHVHFICDEVHLVQDLVNEAAKSPERREKTLKGYAVVPSKGPDVVMRYELTLSVKNRSR